MLWIRARWLPSTNTFTVPSGSLSICRMFEMQPILYRSSAVGSSLAADFCATRRMLLPASMAISMALIDFGRPTKSGMTMCGNTTTSRSGSSGYWLGADAVSSAMAFPGKRINSYIGAERPRSSRVPQGDDSRRSSRARHLRRFGVDGKGLAFADHGVLAHHAFAPIFDRPQHSADAFAVLPALHVRAEADAALLGAAADDLLQAVEPSAADEQDVGGVHLHEILVGMLAAALRRHGRDRPLDQLQQRLLHALAGNVPGDRRVVGLARDLVDLVDIDDAALRLVDVVVAFLEQPLDDVRGVLADVARLGERGRIGDHERNVQQARHRLREQRLARSGRADEEDVRFGELDFVVLRQMLQPLVVVVHRDR